MHIKARGRKEGKNKVVDISSIPSVFDKYSILEQTVWPSNHTSHTSVYFNELVANVFLDDMGMIIFDL